MTNRHKSTDLPARRRPRNEVATHARVEVPAELVEQTAVLVSKKWGPVTGFSRQECEAIARLVHSTYPELGPAQVLEYFDVLGGRIYHNSSFYLDLANRDPYRVGPPRFENLKPGKGALQSVYD